MEIKEQVKLDEKLLKIFTDWRKFEDIHRHDDNLKIFLHTQKYRDKILKLLQKGAKFPSIRDWDDYRKVQDCLSSYCYNLEYSKPESKFYQYTNTHWDEYKSFIISMIEYGYPTSIHRQKEFGHPYDEDESTLYHLKSLIEFAEKRDDFNFIKSLRDYGVPLTEFIDIFDTSVKNQKLDYIKYFVDQDILNLPRTFDKSQALFYAMENNDFNLFKFLIDNGANINVFKQEYIGERILAPYHDLKYRYASPKYSYARDSIMLVAKAIEIRENQENEFYKYLKLKGALCLIKSTGYDPAYMDFCNIAAGLAAMKNVDPKRRYLYDDDKIWEGTEFDRIYALKRKYLLFVMKNLNNPELIIPGIKYNGLCKGTKNALKSFLELGDKELLLAVLDYVEDEKDRNIIKNLLENETINQNTEKPQESKSITQKTETSQVEKSEKVEEKNKLDNSENNPKSEKTFE